MTEREIEDGISTIMMDYDALVIRNGVIEMMISPKIVFCRNKSETNYEVGLYLMDYAGNPDCHMGHFAFETSWVRTSKAKEKYFKGYDSMREMKEDVEKMWEGFDCRVVEWKGFDDEVWEKIKERQKRVDEFKNEHGNIDKDSDYIYWRNNSSTYDKEVLHG